MDDYISRQWLLDEYDKRHKGPPGGARKIIEEAPAADVQPVVYGHMIGKEEAEKIYEEDYSDYPFGQCSVCGHCDWDCVESEGFNYCPYCGAKMGGTP